MWRKVRWWWWKLGLRRSIVCGFCLRQFLSLLPMFFLLLLPPPCYSWSPSSALTKWFPIQTLSHRRPILTERVSDADQFSCFQVYHSKRFHSYSSLEITFGRNIFMILRKHRLIKVWIFLMTDFYLLLGFVSTAFTTLYFSPYPHEKSQVWQYYLPSLELDWLDLEPSGFSWATETMNEYCVLTGR